jgi:uncharacterized membrane protein required for colicin V production
MNNLPLNWFDFVVIVCVIVGIYRGRKRGMSEELLPLLMWLSIVIGAGMGYAPLSEWSSRYTHLSPLISNIAAYLLIMAVIKGIFVLIKRMAGEKLLGADLFGRTEYYLGMLSGVIRWLCMVIVGLALMQSRLVTDDELAKLIKQDKDIYGSTFFPRFGEVQRDIFKRSFTGPYATQYVGRYLIEPVSYNDPMKKRETIGGKAREREIEDLMKKK